MKNLKKLISVIIAVIMLVGSFATVSAAGDYADVESTNSFYKAIKVLSGLGIVNGDDEGNFNPDNDIKRSEMVALVCRAMGEEDIAQASASNAFADVAANHWAAGYIAWGVNRGIINGMGDGTFAPDASVSYQDAVVMIMRALGYDRIAQRAENGGYPTGYLKLASQSGVLKDAGYDNQAAAPRKVVAQLIYNSLTAPLVDVNYYGVNVEDDRYVIYNGKNGTDLRTLLTYSNGVLKVKAKITATPKADASYIDKNGNYMVGITITDAFDYAMSDIAKELNETVSSGEIKTKLYVGETEAAELLGVTIEAYIAENEDLGDWAILALVADNKSVVTETIEANLSTIVYDKTGTQDIISYYEDLNDRKATEFEVADTLTVYYNGVKTTSISDLQAAMRAASKVVLSGTKNADFDSVFLTDYAYAKVVSVNAAEEIIKLKRGYIDFSEEARDEDFIYSIYDAKGNAIAIDDIAEGDILNILTAYGVDYNDAACDFVDIYVSNETVTGKISEKRTSGEFVIDGQEYVANTPGDLKIGDEGVFYLTIDGKIYDSEAVSTISKNFAFLVDIGSETIFSTNTYTLKLFTKDGEADYEVASKVKIIKADGTYANYDASEGEQDAWFGTSGTFKTAIVNEVTDAEADAKAAIKATFATRFFSYKTDADGKISEIRLAGSGSEIASKSTTAKWDSDFEEFAGEEVVDVPMFVAPIEYAAGKATLDMNDLTMGSFTSLKDGQGYSAITYTLKDKDEFLAVLLAEATGFAFDGTHMAVVKATGDALDAEGEEVKSITFVQSGEVVTLTKDADIKAANDVADLAIGDIFFYTANSDNEIINLEKIYDAGTRALADPNKYDINENDFAFVYGIVAEAGDKITLAKEFEIVSGEFKAKETDGNTSKYGVNEIEGATYAWVEEAMLTRNGVKTMSITGVKETIRATQVYALVGMVNEAEKLEDMVVIAYNPTEINSIETINALATNFEFNVED